MSWHANLEMLWNYCDILLYPWHYSILKGQRVNVLVSFFFINFFIYDKNMGQVPSLKVTMTS